MIPYDSYAQEPTKPSKWIIFSDKYNLSKDGKYTLLGNVIIKNKEKTLKADKVVYDSKAETANAEGNIRLTSGKDILTGSRIDINLKTDQGTLYNGKVFLSDNHFYLSGKEIKKTGKDTYTAKSARVTSCDGPSPDWVITGKKIKVRVEGYGTIKHAAFWTKKLPILYSPYFVFPAKQKRQTGFLIPEIGVSSKLGYEYSQPFFWAISENTDATLYYDYLSERGNKLGAEFRYVINPESKGAVMFDYLDDEKEDDGSGEWGYVEKKTDIIRENSERYWFRMKHATTFDNGIITNLDLDIVSDQDYLKDFRYGYSGYAKTEFFYNEALGRSLDSYDDNIRENSLGARKKWKKFNLSTRLVWNDNIVKRQQKEDDDEIKNTTLQSLPSIEFNGLKQKIASTPFYYDLDTEYKYYYREDIDDKGESNMKGSKLTGHRGDIYSRLYTPLNFKYYFNFEPSLGLRETLWYVDQYEEEEDERENSYSRFMQDLKLDLSTDFHKVFNAHVGRVDKIKHKVLHNLVYNYIPDYNQDDLPYFVSKDRIKKKNAITYSLTNTFISRFDSIVDQEKKDYREFLRVKLSLSYDLNEYNEEKDDEEDEREPFLPLEFEVEFSPLRYMALTSDGSWSFYGEKFEEFNTGIRLSDKRGDSIFTEYRYLRDDKTYDADKETVYCRVNGVLNRYLNAFAEFEYNVYNDGIYEDDFAKKAAGLFFKKQCWSVELGVMEEINSDNSTNDIRYSFLINLSGLGGYGQQFNYR